MHAPRSFAGALVAAALIPVLAATFAQAKPPHPPMPRETLCDADNGGLVLPKGFCAVVVAKGVGKARHMAVRPNGDLYVAIDNDPANNLTGHVLALRDTDGDARPDVSATFGPDGGNGIAWSNGQLFFSPRIASCASISSATSSCPPVAWSRSSAVCR